MSNNNSSPGGIGFFGVLFIVFLVLKLCGTIEWSWWWITCPLWGPSALVIIGLGIYIPIKWHKGKDERNRISSGYNRYDWRTGGRSKWLQRLEEMHKNSTK